MSLPDAWVERIFSRMAVRYGTEWTMKWTGIDPAAVKADWADVLANASPESIAYALGFLPLERVPTATQFREICGRAPSRVEPPKALEGPPADPERVASELLRLRELQRRESPRAWAYHLKAREEKNRRALTRAQRDMWREALRTEPELKAGWFTPIESDRLPPTMRGVQIVERELEAA